MARVTLQTIADEVGVGKMTVSNAYSRPRHVSPALRERIFQVAEELGYAGPDASGRALARRRTGLVGVLLTSSPDEAFENLVALGFVSAIARALTPRALSLALLSPLARQDVVPASDVPMDGLIVYACAAPLSSSMLTELTPRSAGWSTSTIGSRRFISARLASSVVRQE